ncbi:MAG: putative ribosome biogenesis RLP24 [Trebouxia sp. A1-2]|nr:MAG: putative ribosome biogenesis RLP24 [Trebouxia sp. A1-2]
MRLEKCWFCSSTIYPGHGISFVRNDASVFNFCRSKCHKNFKMKRNPRKVKWTKAYRKLAGKELAEDTTFEMERQRNKPVKYNRELVHKSVKAMQKVEEVRVARQDRFHEARMKRAAKQQNRADQKELETGIDLIEAPVARLHREQQAQAETEVQPMAVEQAEPVKEKVQAKEKASKQKLRIPVEKPKKRVTAMES